MLISFLLNHVHSGKASPADAGARSRIQNNASNASGAVSHDASTGATSDTTNQTGSSATITANDFLTLLVTEIQNQDPTSQTDPMQYITQLVGVNSLQQLLQMNQTLSTIATDGSSATPSSNAVSTASGSPTANSAAASAAIQSAQLTSGAAVATRLHQLPMAANGQATSASTNAVAQALTQPTVMPQQVLPPTQVPLNPEVLRALEHSIPGAKLAGSSSVPQ